MSYSSHIGIIAKPYGGHLKIMLPQIVTLQHVAAACGIAPTFLFILHMNVHAHCVSEVK